MSVMGVSCIGQDLSKRQILEKSCDISNVIWNNCCASKPPTNPQSVCCRIQMLRWKRGYTKSDKTIYDHIRQEYKYHRNDKMQEGRLRSSGYILMQQFLGTPL